MKIKLGHIANTFDGQLSFYAYSTLGKLIRQHGPLAMIDYAKSEDPDINARNIHMAIVAADRDPSGIETSRI